MQKPQGRRFLLLPVAVVEGLQKLLKLAVLVALVMLVIQVQQPLVKAILQERQLGLLETQELAWVEVEEAF